MHSEEEGIAVATALFVLVGWLLLCTSPIWVRWLTDYRTYLYLRRQLRRRR